ncbi:hypothetical protein, partial [Burkholderia vietnamiensis]|uniref:hypothetical protein n=1 Tax=Burkholderia vietnamiensis TaxID=60552 RepID=UPI001ABAFC29
KEIYNRHCATPKPAESVTFPKSAVTFAEIRTQCIVSCFNIDQYLLHDRRFAGVDAGPEG